MSTMTNVPKSSILKKFQKGAAYLLSISLGVGMVMPLAQAIVPPISQGPTPPQIQNVTYSPTTFYTQVPGENAVMTFQYDLTTGNAANAQVTEQILNDQNVVICDFGNIGPDTKTAGHITLTWDGKIHTGGIEDGSYPHSPQYKLSLLAHTATAPDATYSSPLFDVKVTAAPVVTLLSTPAGVYYKNSGNYAVNYSLTRNSGSAWTVSLKIKNLSTNDEATVSEPKTTDDNFTINWDGKINNVPAAVGAYSWDLWATAAVNSYSVESTHLTGTLAVSNPNSPSASISNLNVMPSPYDPSNGLATFSYTLSNSSGASSVNAAVYSQNNLNSPLKTWALNNQSNGSTSLTWDGRDAVNSRVPDGVYVFKVGGFDGYTVIITQQTNFTVSSLASANNCAGFTDVSSNNADCPAITYVQNIGAMTGNPNGTFAPQDLLQRDQVIKIILETFNKFDKQVDYCGGQRPFPDVTQNDWSFQYICRAKQLGIATGYLSGPDAGFYRPSRSVNRVEFLALVLRNLADTMPGNNVASYNDVLLNQWFTGYAKYAYDNLLFNHPNLFPTNFMVRVEVARVLFKLHQLGKV